MGRVEKTVFISYRRTNIPWALAIYQNLTSHGYDVFFDYDSIPSGDFEQVIIGNIKARAHFLVVLTPSALERCINPDDWLRREIETALDEKRNIVPVFLEGFDFGSPSISKYLTGKLETLKKYNGQNVPAGFFDEAMEKIRNKFLNVSLDAVLHPVSAIIQKKVKKQQVSASKATQVKEKELTAQAWFEKGYKSADSDEKIRFYGKAITLNPDFFEAYNNRGNAHWSKGNLDSAIKDYSKAIRIKPDYAEAYYGRGIAHWNKGNLDSSIKDYSKAIRLKPDFVKPYNGRGIARADKGDLDGAIKDYTIAIRLKPDYAEAYYGRGIAHWNKGNLDSSIKDYSKAIRIKPDYAYPYSGRGIARADEGDLDGAIKDYTIAIRLKPDYAEAYYNRANIWKAKKDYYAAIADYQKYLNLGGGARDGDQKEVEGSIRELKKKIK